LCRLGTLVWSVSCVRLLARSPQLTGTVVHPLKGTATPNHFCGWGIQAIDYSWANLMSYHAVQTSSARIHLESLRVKFVRHGMVGGGSTDVFSSACLVVFCIFFFCTRNHAYVCICRNIGHLYICIHIHICIHTCSYTYTCIRPRIYTHAYIHTYMHVCIYVYVYIYIVHPTHVHFWRASFELARFSSSPEVTLGFAPYRILPHVLCVGATSWSVGIAYAPPPCLLYVSLRCELSLERYSSFLFCCTI